jgi:transposase
LAQESSSQIVGNYLRGVVSFLVNSVQEEKQNRARSVSKYRPEKKDALSRWFNALALRSGKTKVIVALANKLTRIAWVIVTTNEEF